jgi:hypothetical protein
MLIKLRLQNISLIIPIMAVLFSLLSIYVGGGCHMLQPNKIKSGYWSIATQKHLKAFTTDSSNFDEFDELNIAGKTGRFLGGIRGNKEINSMKKLQKMANIVGISPKELTCIVLPGLERSSDKQVELIKDATGEITGIAEYLFTNESVLEVTGQVFEDSNPSAIQRIAIETMDETKKIPYLQNELIEMLVRTGYKEENIGLAFALQEQFKLIQRTNKSKNTIISNEYVWGPNYKKIAMAISGVDFGKKQNLKEVIDIIQNHQGHPMEKLPEIDKDLMILAQKTGMITPNIIVSGRGFQKGFAFSPNMLEPLTYNDDILDDVKLLLASIRFGENYTQHSTINDPAKFLRSLINYGDIGPHDANSTDYLLLEKKGIVRVVTKTKERYSNYYGCYTNRTGFCLELIRKDVAQEALKFIESPNYNIKTDSEINSFEAINETGSYITAEETRVRFAESPEYIKEAEDYFSSVLRDELL